jgi:hypothetical protein
VWKCWHVELASYPSKLCPFSYPSILTLRLPSKALSIVLEMLPAAIMDCRRACSERARCSRFNHMLLQMELIAFLCWSRSYVGCCLSPRNECGHLDEIWRKYRLKEFMSQELSEKLPSHLYMSSPKQNHNHWNICLSQKYLPAAV